MLELYFGSMNRLPQTRSQSYREPRQKETKPTTKIRPTISVLPEDLIAAGARRVEAGDIARLFNQALEKGQGIGAFEAIPPELRRTLLGQLTAPKTKEKPQKLPKMSMYTENSTKAKMSSILTKDFGIPKELAPLLVDAYWAGNKQVLTEAERAALPMISQLEARLARSNEPTNPSPYSAQPSYRAITNPEDTGRLRTRYQLEEGPRAQEPSYWERRRNTPEEMKRYAYTEKRVPTTQAGLSIGLDEGDKDILNTLLRRFAQQVPTSDSLITQEIMPTLPVQSRQIPPWIRSLWEDAGPVTDLDVKGYLSGRY